MGIYFKSTLLLLALIVSTQALATSKQATFERKLGLAQTGNVEAQYDVAYLYTKGRGVDEDEEEAFIWYNKSADQGLDTGQYKVGMAYLKAVGVDKDLELARVWLQKSAGQGYPPAQYQLGKLLASKHYKDYDGALAWLQKAQNSGYERAASEIRKLKRK
ncbi:hypothetical protein MNBD_GAMMA13-2076 [hydrothermal vent metagenome]|uniref:TETRATRICOPEPTIDE REPEAT FAMILY PROTEIN n=1 Tax=hydrothermal vent metagenome TaxID=652676 RepID=A0A3B0Z103_9ZZZZ